MAKLPPVGTVRLLYGSNPLFSRYSMKKFLAKKYLGVDAAPWYSGKFFSWKSAKTVDSWAFDYAESVSDIGFP